MVWLREDAPGLAYSLQSRVDLANATWQDHSSTAMDTNAIWSATVYFNPASNLEFYRVRTAPLPGTSAPWPNGTYGP